MAHNVSRARQVSQAEDRAIAALAGYVAPGWRLELGPPRIVPDPGLLGCWRRRMALLYRCGRRDCGRRVEPDLEALVRSGHGHLTPAELGAALSCRHPLGCRLKLQAETYPGGVPLVGYLAHPGVLITVRCEGCDHALTLPPEAMIERLRAARRGGPETGVLELASRIRGPCRRCGGMAFESAVIWSVAPGSGPETTKPAPDEPERA